MLRKFACVSQKVNFELWFCMISSSRFRMDVRWVFVNWQCRNTMRAPHTVYQIEKFHSKLFAVKQNLFCSKYSFVSKQSVIQDSILKNQFLISSQLIAQNYRCLKMFIFVLWEFQISHSWLWSFTSVHIPYARHYNPLLIRNRSWILTIHKAKGHST